MRRRAFVNIATGCLIAFGFGGAARGENRPPIHAPLPGGVVERLRTLPPGGAMAPWQRTLIEQLTGPADTAGTTPCFDSRHDPPDSLDGMWLGLNMPRGRYYPGVVYDPLRDRLVIFGGVSGLLSLNDTWTLSLRGTPQWNQLVPAGLPPLARYGFTAVYDSHHDQIVVYGGTPGLHDGVLGDTWGLSLAGTPTWTQIAGGGSGPDARYLAAGVYDPSGDRLVVFGGVTTTYVNDTWALSLDGDPVWTELQAGPRPNPRAQMAVAYDAARDRMLVFGGYEATANTNDLWSLSLGDTPDWTLLHPAGIGPSARRDACAIYDSDNDALVVFGGYSTQELNEAWQLPLTSMGWIRVQPRGGVPPARYAAGAAYDPLGRQMIVFGGAAKSTSYNTTAALALHGVPAWSSLNPPTPPASRYAMSLVYDAHRERLLVFGGIAFTDLYADVWAFDLADVSWTQLTVGGTPPAGRGYASLVLDPLRDRLVVFGGLADFDGTYLNDTWTLNLTGAPVWQQWTVPGAVPAPRYGHTAVLDPQGDRMIVYGGSLAPNSVSNETWALALADPGEWREITAASRANPAPAARYLHAAVFDPAQRRMLISCGSAATTYLNDTWALSLSGAPVWTPVAGGQSGPVARSQMAYAFDASRDRLLLFGGYDGRFDLDDTWQLTLDDAPVWKELSPAGLVPYKRRDSAGLYDPVRDEFDVFGGYDNFHSYADLAALRAAASSHETAVGEPRRAQPDSPFVWVSQARRGRVTIEYAAPVSGAAHLAVWDVRGRRLLDRDLGTTQAGVRRTWSAEEAWPRGVYIAAVRVAGHHATRSFCLVR